MNEIKQINNSDDKKKKVWNKPKCVSGKDFGYFGMVSSTGPYSTPS
jgi:hypothetical protein